VMLVQAADQDALALCPDGLGDGGTPAVVSVVPQFTPVHGHQDDRLAGPLEDETGGEQWIDDFLDRGDPAAHARVADRRCDFLGEGSDGQPGGGGRGGVNGGCGRGGGEEFAAGDGGHGGLSWPQAYSLWNWWTGPATMASTSGEARLYHKQ